VRKQSVLAAFEADNESPIQVPMANIVEASEAMLFNSSRAGVNAHSMLDETL